VEQDGSGRGRGGFNNQRGGPNRGRGNSLVISAVNLNPNPF